MYYIMKIEKEIGDGEDYVYVYYNENDKKLALLEKRDRWECKIGFSSVDPVVRILGQGVQTCLAKDPIIGLLIKTNNGYYTESWIHKELYLHKLRRDSNICGDEWFLTNPNEVEDIFTYKISPSAAIMLQYCEYEISDSKPLGITSNLHRKKINLTQEKLSDSIGVSRDTIWRFFSDDQTIAIGTVLNILKSLDLEITLKSRLPSKDIQIHNSIRHAR